MANGFDFANIGQIFGPGMGATPSGLDALLNEEQRRLLGRNAALSAAAALLQAGAPSRTPINLGQALGSALQAGQAGYQQARAGALQDVMLKTQLDEAARKRQQDMNWQNLLRGGVSAVTPVGMAQPMPAGPAVPTVERELAEPLPAPKDPLAFLTTTQRQLLSAMPSEKAVPEMLKIASEKPEGFVRMTDSEVKQMGLDPRSTWQKSTKTGQVSILSKYEPLFGGGLQGSAYDVLLNKEPDTPEYALAYRALTQPVPMERVQPDGSVKIVYETPAPIPASFSRPTFKGKLPAQRPAVTGAAPMAAPAVTGAAPTAAPETQPSAQIGGPGVKSTPYAPTSGQVADAQKQIFTIDKVLSAADALEKNIRDTGMQIGGMGAAGGTQEALFQDVILQLKELQNLGVLNGPDERILLQQLANPTSLSSYIKGYGGPDYVLSKLAELKKKGERELELIKKKFPVPLPGQPVGPPLMAPPTTITTPPSIDRLLRKYPGQGGG